MMKFIKSTIRMTPLYRPLVRWLELRARARLLAAWRENGRPVPPPHEVKQQTLRNYAKEFGLRTLIETGTFRGDMVEAMKGTFDRIYTIELSKDLFEEARARFSGVKNVECIHGDSGVELGRILERVREPALFWLDGHYSGGVTARGAKETPVYEELRQILSSPIKSHVIVIDDARCFGTAPDYPGIEELRDFVASKRQDLDVAVQDDSIRITPRPSASVMAVVCRGPRGA
jgi:hypothetical protein